MADTPQQAANRQQKYRAKKKKAGKCAWCPEPAEEDKSLCKRCATRNRLRTRKARGSKAWTPMSAGRPLQ